MSSTTIKVKAEYQGYLYTATAEVNYKEEEEEIQDIYYIEETLSKNGVKIIEAKEKGLTPFMFMKVEDELIKQIHEDLFW